MDGHPPGHQRAGAFGGGAARGAAHRSRLCAGLAARWVALGLLALGGTLGGEAFAHGRQPAAAEMTTEATPTTECAVPAPATPEGARFRGADELTPTDKELALIDAAGRGDEAAVVRLLDGGASVDAQDARRRTALVAAAYGNHLDVACRLIEAGADVNFQDDTGQSAFLIAASEGSLDLLRLTLRAGADVGRIDRDGSTGLARAAEWGRVEAVAELLATDVEIDRVNRLGRTALAEAIVLGDGGDRHTEVVRRLVAAGANVDLADGEGMSPLAHARQRGYDEIVAILVDARAR